MHTLALIIGGRFDAQLRGVLGLRLAQSCRAEPLSSEDGCHRSRLSGRRSVPPRLALYNPHPARLVGRLAAWRGHVHLGNDLKAHR